MVSGLAKEIFSKVGQSPPGRKSQSIYYNKSRDRLDVYESDVNGQLKLSDFKSDYYPVVQTSDVKGTLATIMHWLQPDIKQPFLLGTYLSMVSHKISVITIFGHKDLKILNLVFFMEFDIT